jgi:acyl-CoA hydrolase
MKRVSDSQLESVASGIPPGSRVVSSGNFATPSAVLNVIDKAVESYRLNMLNAQIGIPCRAGVVHETSFVGPGMRDSPQLSYVPARLSLVPQLFESTLRPDVVVVTTSSVRGDAVSLGTEVNVLPAAIEMVRRSGGLVIAEVNRRMPFTFGDAVVPTDQIDYAIEVDEPLMSAPSALIDGAARQIGERVSARVADGSTLQLGIGAIPDAALSGLAGSRGLRIWSEMISDGVVRLDRLGALDPNTSITASFMCGSADLYDWADGNPRLRMRRTETVNDPSNIRAHDRMVSINSALQVDFYAQVNASRIKGRVYSGFGGQTDFVVGALHSRGGQAIIALRSWHPRAGCSTIVPMVEEPVTSFQPSAVITECGTAEIFGRPERDQVTQLIDQAAHPDACEDLWEEAMALVRPRPVPSRPLL